MSLVPRLVSMVLILAITGGAQACVYVCSQPAKPANRTLAQRSPCRHCGEEKPASTDSEPLPTTPCKHCQAASQDRISIERDHLAVAAVDLAVFSPSAIFQPVLTPDVCRIDTHPTAQPPPGELLHQFCLLLI
jgi:hypothetical protein